MFQGLRNLYSLDLKGNKLAEVENGAWANLPALRHLDISTNELEVLFPQTFDNTLLPTGDRRSLFIYGTRSNIAANVILKSGTFCA